MGTIPFTSFEDVVQLLEGKKELVFEEVPIKSLSFIQARDPNSERPVELYREEMIRGAVFPPIDAVLNPDKMIATVVDGNTRAEATQLNGIETITVRFRLGGERDILMAAACSNFNHGQPRSQADRRRAVQLLFTDPAMAAWTNNRLAAIARVAPQTVDLVRQALEDEAVKRGEKPAGSRKRLAKRGGQTYEVTVAAKKPSEAADPVRGIVALVKRRIKAFDAEARTRLADLLDRELRPDA